MTIWPKRFSSILYGKSARLLSSHTSRHVIARQSNSLYCVYQRREALDADFEAVAGLDGTDAAGRPSEDNVAGHEGHVGGDEADQFVAIEDELAGVRILPELPVLELLDGQVVRINL